MSARKGYLTPSTHCFSTISPNAPGSWEPNPGRLQCGLAVCEMLLDDKTFPRCFRRSRFGEKGRKYNVV